MKFIFFSEKSITDELNQKFQNQKNIIGIKSKLEEIYSFLPLSSRNVILVPILPDGSCPFEEKYNSLFPNLNVIIKSKIIEIQEGKKKNSPLGLGTSILFPLGDVQILALVSYFHESQELVDLRWLLYQLHGFLFNLQNKVDPNLIDTLLIPYLDHKEFLKNKSYTQEVEEAIIRGLPPHLHIFPLEIRSNLVFSRA